MSRARIRLLWVLLFAACVLAIVFKTAAPWLTAFPANWQLPITTWVAALTSPVFIWMQPAGRAMAAGLDIPLRLNRATLLWVPWPAFMLFLTALSAYASGWRLAVFCVLALSYLVVTGYWAPSMNTLCGQASRTIRLCVCHVMFHLVR